MKVIITLVLMLLVSTGTVYAASAKKLDWDNMSWEDAYRNRSKAPKDVIIKNLKWDKEELLRHWTKINNELEKYESCIAKNPQNPDYKTCTKFLHSDIFEGEGLSPF
jgi:hypothetical protein